MWPLELRAGHTPLSLSDRLRALAARFGSEPGFLVAIAERAVEGLVELKHGFYPCGRLLAASGRGPVYSAPTPRTALRTQVYMDSVWYFVVNGVQTGPVSLTELKAAAAAGKLSPSDLVWQEGTADWVPAGTTAGLFSPAPPPRHTRFRPLRPHRLPPR